jgi:RNA polymerase-binding transcription factor DksA
VLIDRRDGAARELKALQDMSTDMKTARRRCSLCGTPIAAARLEALPGVTTCIECAKKHPRKVDTSGVDLSQASPINRNGFAPKD